MRKKTELETTQELERGQPAAESSKTLPSRLKHDPQSPFFLIRAVFQSSPTFLQPFIIAMGWLRAQVNAFPGQFPHID